MTQTHFHPIGPVPPPILGREPDTWQYDTIANRLPDMARRVIAENDFSPEQNRRLQQLITEMPEGPMRFLDDPQAPDAAAWASYVAPFVGQSWLDVPWFFAEMVFFRRILEATGYFGPGQGEGIDPYWRQKEAGLVAGLGIVPTIADVSLGGYSIESLIALLTLDLWGNQADQSIWPADANGQAGESAPEQAHLLINQIPEAVETLDGLRVEQPVRIDILVDNAGVELVGDLMTADYLLRHAVAGVVRFHVKPYPTFVSDATILDVVETIERLATESDENMSGIGRRLRRALADGRLSLQTHPFWVSPLAFWEMPPDVIAELSQADLVIVKGDMNYRRLHGDRHWPLDTPFAAVVNGAPGPLLPLRVVKAELATGLDTAQVAAVSAADPGWMTNGRWGMAPYYPGPRSTGEHG